MGLGTRLQSALTNTQTKSDAVYVDVQMELTNVPTAVILAVVNLKEILSWRPR